MSNIINSYAFGGFLTGTEYIIFATESGIKYWSVNIAAGTTAELDSFALPSGSHRSIAIQSPFVFIPTEGFFSLGQFAWNGTDLTERYDAVLPTSFSIKCMLTLPGNAPYVITRGTEGFGYGMSIYPYQTAPTYSYGTRGTVAGAALTNWAGPMYDLRVGTVGQPVVGNTFLVAPAGDDIDMRVYTASGITFTAHSTVTPNHGTGNYESAVDRDLGKIILANDTNARVYSVNMSTRALSFVGTGTLPSFPAIMAFCSGFLITIETNIIYSYSVSGTTITQVSSISIGGTNPSVNSRIYVSPYSNHVYFFNNVGTTNNLKVFYVNPSTGALTTKVTASIGSFNSSGAVGGSLCVFSPTALPTVA